MSCLSATRSAYLGLGRQPCCWIPGLDLLVGILGRFQLAWQCRFASVWSSPRSSSAVESPVLSPCQQSVRGLLGPCGRRGSGSSGRGPGCYHWPSSFASLVDFEAPRSPVEGPCYPHAPPHVG